MKIAIQILAFSAFLLAFASCKRNEQPAKFIATENLTRGKNQLWALETVIKDGSDTLAQRYRGSLYRISAPVLDSAGNVIGSAYDTVNMKNVPTREYTVYGVAIAYDFDGKRTEAYWKWQDDTAQKLVHFNNRGDSSVFEIEELTRTLLRLKFTSNDTLMPGSVSYIYK
jgi:hypothetical protein